MTDMKRLAAVTGAYTGILVGKFSDMHEYIEEVLGRPVWTHELGTEEVTEEIRVASKEEFIKLWEETLESN